MGSSKPLQPPIRTDSAIFRRHWPSSYLLMSFAMISIWINERHGFCHPLISFIIFSWSLSELINQISYLLIWVWPYALSVPLIKWPWYHLSVTWVAIPSLHYQYQYVHRPTQSYPYLASYYRPVRHMLKCMRFHIDIIMKSGQRTKETYSRKTYDSTTMWLSCADRSSPMSLTCTYIHDLPFKYNG